MDVEGSKLYEYAALCRLCVFESQHFSESVLEIHKSATCVSVSMTR